MMPVATIFAASALALVVVSLVTRPPAREVVERFFENVRPGQDPRAGRAGAGLGNGPQSVRSGRGINGSSRIIHADRNPKRKRARLARISHQSLVGRAFLSRLLRLTGKNARATFAGSCRQFSRCGEKCGSGTDPRLRFGFRLPAPLKSRGVNNPVT